MNWLLFKNSMVVSLSVAPLSVGVGFCAELCVAGLPRGWRNTLIALSVTAMLLPSFLLVNCWLYYLGVNGIWRSWLPVNIYSVPGAIGILASLYWPIPMLASLAAWRRIESPQLESDPLLRGFALVRFLLWPIARPTIGVAALIVFVLALNNFSVPSILQVRVLPANLWISYNTNLNLSAALLASLPLLLAPLALLYFALKSQSPWPFRERLPSSSTFRRQITGSLHTISLAFTMVIVTLSVGLPLGHLLASAETWTQLPLVIRAASGAITNSALYAGSTATVCVLAGFAFWRYRSASLLWFAFLVPGLFVALLLIAIFNRRGLGIIYGTGAMVLLACGIRYCALAWSTIRGAMQTVDTELADAARLEGARGAALLRHVYWPQVAPYAAFAWYLVYLLCLWDVETLLLVLPPGGETLALRIFNMLHYGHTGQVNALCVVLLVLALLPLAVTVLLPRRDRAA
jgi:iron(III) transport system permease protein